MKKLTLRIAKDGKVQMEVHGAVGPACKEFSALFEKAVGDVVECRLKSEYELTQEQVRDQIQDSAS